MINLLKGIWQTFWVLIEGLWELICMLFEKFIGLFL